MKKERERKEGREGEGGEKEKEERKEGMNERTNEGTKQQRKKRKKKGKVGKNQMPAKIQSNWNVHACIQKYKMTQQFRELFGCFLGIQHKPTSPLSYSTPGDVSKRLKNMFTQELIHKNSYQL